MDSALEPSKNLLKFVDVISASISGPVLDIPCGNGRNALPFADRGLEVFCLDKDQSRLKGLQRIANSKKYQGKLILINQDLNDLSKRFYDRRFGAIINVHYVDLRLLSWWKKILLPGGFLYMETFGNRGENYVELPVRHGLLKLLNSEFEIKQLEERPAGPKQSNRVTLKLLAKKIV